MAARPGARRGEVAPIAWRDACRETPDGSVIRVRVKPNASREVVEGVADGALSVRVTAPPVDDRANRAVVRLLADLLDLAPSRLEIVRGGTARRKEILARGWRPPD